MQYQKTAFTECSTGHSSCLFWKDHVSMNLSTLEKNTSTFSTPFELIPQQYDGFLLPIQVGAESTWYRVGNMENRHPFIGLGTISVLTPGVLVDKALCNTSCPCMTKKFAYNSQCKLRHCSKSPARYQFTIDNDFGAVHYFIGECAHDGWMGSGFLILYLGKCSIRTNI